MDNAFCGFGKFGFYQLEAKPAFALPELSFSWNAGDFILSKLTFPEALRKNASQRLALLIVEADGHLRTGFLERPYLTWGLDGAGKDEVAFDLLFKGTYPSWFYPINQGATTMWERWSSYSHKDGFDRARMNLFNHYAYGAVGQWLGAER